MGGKRRLNKHFDLSFFTETAANLIFTVFRSSCQRHHKGSQLALQTRTLLRFIVPSNSRKTNKVWNGNKLL